jgi:hypothetical protein
MKPTVLYVPVRNIDDALRLVSSESDAGCPAIAVCGSGVYHLTSLSCMVSDATTHSSLGPNLDFRVRCWNKGPATIIVIVDRSWVGRDLERLVDATRASGEWRVFLVIPGGVDSSVVRCIDVGRTISHVSTRTPRFRHIDTSAILFRHNVWFIETADKPKLYTIKAGLAVFAC